MSEAAVKLDGFCSKSAAEAAEAWCTYEYLSDEIEGRRLRAALKKMSGVFDDQSFVDEKRLVDQRYEWIVLFFQYATQEAPELAWEAICLIWNRVRFEERMAAVIAAGPLEDLLGRRGAEIISLVEKSVVTDPEMRTLLQGVWRNQIDRDVWGRLVALRGK